MLSAAGLSLNSYELGSNVVSMEHMSLNLCTDNRQPTSNILPCRITGVGITSSTPTDLWHDPTHLESSLSKRPSTHDIRSKCPLRRGRHN